MVPLKLSAVKPDFTSILLQLQLYLQSTGTWVDLQTSSTGQTLLEMMAATAAFNQFAIESAARETTLTTAARDSSVYAITRMLGVRIHRKTPASVSVQLLRDTIDTSESIATYTQFDVNGTPYFNRQALIFVTGANQAAERLYYGTPMEVIGQTSFKLEHSLVVALNIGTGDRFLVLTNSTDDVGTLRTVEYIGGNVGNSRFELVAGQSEFTDLSLTTRLSLLSEVARLYEGTVLEETFTSNGTAFQQYYLSTRFFKVSDIDVEVRVYDEQSKGFQKWERTDDGLWVSGAYDNVYFDNTSGMGEAIIAFGDGANGVSPSLGSQIKIKYVTTAGATANNGLTNLAVALPSFNNVQGSTVSVVAGGADEKPASYYRTMAPLIFKARNRGVTITDYKAVALDYPGIVSVSLQCQRDIAPNDLRWMNQVQMCLLPAATNSTMLTQPEWDDFLVYMDKKKHAAVNIVPKNPTRAPAHIDLTLALRTQYVATSVVPKAEAAVRALFIRQSDTLGRRIPVSDITRAALVEGVDYVVVNNCKLLGFIDHVGDLVPEDNTNFLELDILILNTKYSEREVYA